MSKAKFNPTSLTLLSLKKIHSAIKDVSTVTKYGSVVNVEERLDPETGLLKATRFTIVSNHFDNLGGPVRLDILACDQGVYNSMNPDPAHMEDKQEVAYTVTISIAQKDDKASQQNRYGYSAVGFLQKEIKLSKLSSAGKESAYEAYQEVFQSAIDTFNKVIEVIKDKDLVTPYMDFYNNVWLPEKKKADAEGQDFPFETSRYDSFVYDDLRECMKPLSDITYDGVLFERDFSYIPSEPAEPAEPSEPADDVLDL